MQPDKTPHDGGNTNGAVVRVGATGRKPWTPNSPAVGRFMDAIRADGVEVPQTFWRAEHGRQVIEYVPGRIALDASALTMDELIRVGVLVRSIHDASNHFTPAEAFADDVLLPTPTDEVICHNDLGPWNLVIGDPWVFIDWVGAGGRSQLWDLAYAAQNFTLLDEGTPLHPAAMRPAAFADG